jgi:Acetyltransferases
LELTTPTSTAPPIAAGTNGGVIRAATAGDVDALVHIENRAFVTDRISRRAFRYLLSRANAATLVETGDDGRPRGYAMVLFNRGTSLARLYSIAVDPDDHGQGVGGRLLAAAEEVARTRGAVSMRLEVRADADAVKTFYRSRGYRAFAVQSHYYEDDVAAVRMEKALTARRDPSLARVPYYPQSLEFTCGPAALLMAMRAHDASVPIDARAELRVWRESTTIFMTSGLGGCSPEGLALSAHRRGFAVELLLSDRGTMFVESVRSPTKREVIRLVQEDFREQLAACGIPIEFRSMSVDVLRARFEAGGIPVVLISSYRIAREKQPHWVVVTGFDEEHVYLHDPDVAERLDKTIIDCMQIPVRQNDFLRMARYGKAQHQAALIIGKAPSLAGATGEDQR